MKRRSFLAMLGLSPVVGATAVQAIAGEPSPTELLVKGTEAVSRALGVFQSSANGTSTIVFRADQFVITAPMTEPLTFDASGRCLENRRYPKGALLLSVARTGPLPSK